MLAGPYSIVAADCVVIGCDSMLYIDGRLCGKPSPSADARQQWQSIAGRAGELYTGHCVIRLLDNEIVYRDDRNINHHSAFRAHRRPTTWRPTWPSGESLRVAGGFTLDGLGGWFIDGVDGDPWNVVGLSLPLLRKLLQGVGISVATLWAGGPTGAQRHRN